MAPSFAFIFLALAISHISTAIPTIPSPTPATRRPTLDLETTKILNTCVDQYASPICDEKEKLNCLKDFNTCLIENLHGKSIYFIAVVEALEKEGVPLEVIQELYKAWYRNELKWAPVNSTSTISTMTTSTSMN
ncbi:hypothetical protein TWF694_004524 [Orbilia ellipsospora]|uniref:Uncharacterized protein n=1 Tax=Orbilia ellipsospora TaxID=2528407 RepID=A0AAV9WVB8_9PEZI